MINLSLESAQYEAPAGPLAHEIDTLTSSARVLPPATESN